MDTEQQFALLREQLAQLTQRIYRLEQLLSERASAAPPAPAHTAPVVEQSTLLPLPPVPPPRVAVEPTPPPPPPPTVARMLEQFAFQQTQSPASSPVPEFNAQAAESLETRIGSRWLNRVGIVAVLTGASYFLKYAFENNWIGPPMRVLIGLAVGIGITWWSERFRRKDYKAFSYSLKAVGVGILYLSLWAAFHLYALVPQAVAFFAMVLVTAGVACMALAQDAELLMGLALIGGFLTPVLAGRDVNAEGALLSYLLMLDAAALALQRFRTWPRIVGSAWLGTLMLYVAWRNEWYEQSAFGETFLFIAALFAVFAAVPLVTRLLPETKLEGFPQLIVLVLPVANSLAFFAELSSILPAQNHNQVLAAYSAALAAVMAGVGFAMLRREQEAGDEQGLMSGMHWAIGAVFAIIAVPLRYRGDSLCVGWLAEGALLYWVGAAGGRKLLRGMGAAVALMGTIQVAYTTLDKLQPTVIWNERFALYLGAIAVIAFLVWREGAVGSAETEPLRAVGLLLIVGLALTALNLEVRDYFAPLTASGLAANDALRTARECAHSAMWLFVGAATFAASMRARHWLLRLVGAAVSLAGIVYLVVETSTATQPAFLLNERFTLFLVSIAVVGLMVRREGALTGEETEGLRAAGLLLIVGLVLLSLNLEVHDFWARRELPLPQVPDSYNYWAQHLVWQTARDCWHFAVSLLVGAVTYAIGAQARRMLLRVTGIVVAAVSIIYLFFQTIEMTQPTLILNERFAMYLLAVAFLGMMIWQERRATGAVGWPMSAIAACIGLNVLALLALCFEARDVFQLGIAALQQPFEAKQTAANLREVRGLEIARDFSYSAIAMCYGAALMWLGFARRTALLRWQALVLMGAASVKVFTYDVSYLDKIFRILSFIVLGGILLAISFAYQKDWLGLQRKHAAEGKG